MTGILLWPFGGICFSTRPDSSNVKEHLTIELKIVSAGPATHFPMIGFWMSILAMLRTSWGLNISLASALIPWHSVPTPNIAWGFWSFLTYNVVVHAIQLNVMLLLFNVLFPMYPMDGSKIIICILGLCCRVPPRACAWVLHFFMQMLFLNKYS